MSECGSNTAVFFKDLEVIPMCGSLRSTALEICSMQEVVPLPFTTAPYTLISHTGQLAANERMTGTEGQKAYRLRKGGTNSVGQSWFRGSHGVRLELEPSWDHISLLQPLLCPNLPQLTFFLLKAFTQQVTCT